MINDFAISLLKHSEISNCLVDKIITLKQQHWPYSRKSQIDWVNANVRGNDYHLLIEDSNSNILAYMNLVNRKVNGVPNLGVGNVCVNKGDNKSGLGALLMNICKYYSKQLSLDLVLLCKLDLVLFYEKCGFNRYQSKVYIDGELFEKCVMFSNDTFISEAEIHINEFF